MFNRIKEIRKHMHLSQTEFGRKIGVTIGVIRNLETGTTTLTQPLFDLLCSTYNVNPEWLRTGNGDMFIKPDNDSLSYIKNEYDLSDDAANFIQNFLELSGQKQDELLNILKELL